ARRHLHRGDLGHLHGRGHRGLLPPLPRPRRLSDPPRRGTSAGHLLPGHRRHRSHVVGRGPPAPPPARRHTARSPLAGAEAAADDHRRHLAPVRLRQAPSTRQPPSRVADLGAARPARHLLRRHVRAAAGAGHAGRPPRLLHGPGRAHQHRRPPLREQAPPPAPRVRPGLAGHPAAGPRLPQLPPRPPGRAADRQPRPDLAPPPAGCGAGPDRARRASEGGTPINTLLRRLRLPHRLGGAGTL
ncbi:MAG: hypothetical protein AVDCRST_MAG76-2171, partial [uncultured Acidimicrobiales bacterium]